MAAARRPRGWRLAGLAGIVAVGLAVDLVRPPAEQLSARALVAAIHLYRATLSPLLGGIGVHCRMRPSCSRYAEACLRGQGTLRGGWLALVRVARCGPWTPLGTIDMPPPPLRGREERSKLRQLASPEPARGD